MTGLIARIEANTWCVASSTLRSRSLSYYVFNILPARSYSKPSNSSFHKRSSSAIYFTSSHQATNYPPGATKSFSENTHASMLSSMPPTSQSPPRSGRTAGKLMSSVRRSLSVVSSTKKRQSAPSVSSHSASRSLGAYSYLSIVVSPSLE